MVILAGVSDWGLAKKKPPSGNSGAFLLVNKPGDTYFHAGRHYHRLAVLNYCVRDGNRCFHCDMVAGKGRVRREAGRVRLYRVVGTSADQQEC